MKKVVLIFTIIAICLSMPGLASASNWLVMATENNSSGGARYGTHAHIYVPASTVITSMHVNSVYVALSDFSDGAECGWFSYAPFNPYQFCVWVDDWIYHEQIGVSVTKGAWHVFSVYNNNNDSRWTYYYDGTWPRLNQYIGGLNYGRTYTSSERNYLNETNYAHFNGIQMKLVNDTWLDWTNLAASFDFGIKKVDPDYYVHKISNTEHTVIN